MIKHDVEPLLHPVSIADLRPTQMTVGLREVHRKRAEWRRRVEHDGSDFLGTHMVPAILGPKRRPYLIDHHHLVRALHEEGVQHILISVVADLAGLDRSSFWTFMDNRNWIHPFDADGKRHDHGHLPKSIGKMKDDPYRSLAGELQRAGGFAKDNSPYSEFLWADYLRRRIDLAVVEETFETAVLSALHLAHKRSANHLPGWCGRSD